MRRFGLNTERTVQKALIRYLGEMVIMACDGRCSKAWGIDKRPRMMVSEAEGDYCFLSDDDLLEAPVDPGTTEYGEHKPRAAKYFPNKWCVRQCERSEMFEQGTPEIILHDWSEPKYNIPRESQL